jgi:hypothetical protein
MIFFPGCEEIHFVSTSAGHGKIQARYPFGGFGCVRGFS